MYSFTNICCFFCQDLANVYNLNITDIFHFSETDYVSTEQHIQEMEDIVTKTYQRTRGELQNFSKYIDIYLLHLMLLKKMFHVKMHDKLLHFIIYFPKLRL
jgi:hypothetical protein